MRAPSKATAAQRAVVQSRHATPQGPLVAIWRAGGLYQIDWQGPSDGAAEPRRGSRIAGRAGPDRQPDETVGSRRDDPRVADLSDRLDAYFSGAVDALDPVAVDPSGWTAFFAEVYRRCRQIAPGNTRSYQELAALAGRPRAARAVGQAMAQNRVPLVIPCHRVLSAGGGLGGYSGPGGVDTKLWLLRHESEATRGDGDRPGDHAERARFCLKRGPTL